MINFDSRVRLSMYLLSILLKYRNSNQNLVSVKMKKNYLGRLNREGAVHNLTSNPLVVVLRSNREAAVHNLTSNPLVVVLRSNREAAVHNLTSNPLVVVLS